MDSGLLECPSDANLVVMINEVYQICYEVLLEVKEAFIVRCLQVIKHTKYVKYVYLQDKLFDVIIYVIINAPSICQGQVNVLKTLIFEE